MSSEVAHMVVVDHKFTMPYAMENVQSLLVY